MFLFQGTRDDKIVMVHKPIFDAQEEVLVNLQDLKSWRHTKAQPHALVDGAKLKEQLFQHSSVGARWVRQGEGVPCLASRMHGQQVRPRIGIGLFPESEWCMDFEKLQAKGFEVASLRQCLKGERRYPFQQDCA